MLPHQAPSLYHNLLWGFSAEGPLTPGADHAKSRYPVAALASDGPAASSAITASPRTHPRRLADRRPAGVMPERERCCTAGSADLAILGPFRWSAATGDDDSRGSC